MKRTALTAALLLIASGATAVVGYNGSGGDMHIMDSGSSSASGTVAAGPNGTAYRATVSMQGRHTAEDPIGSAGNASFSSDGEKRKVAFTGEIVAGTPCHVIGHSLNETGENSYIINVKTEKDQMDRNGTGCAQVLTAIDYSATFQTDAPFRLEVRHDGQKVETLTHPGYSSQEPSEEQPPQNRGMLTGFINWLSGLF
ncbi:MAG: hypothetical protein ABEJ07_02140 [Candidatus Nanohaloarchaea archaeon]